MQTYPEDSEVCTFVSPRLDEMHNAHFIVSVLFLCRIFHEDFLDPFSARDFLPTVSACSCTALLQEEEGKGRNVSPVFGERATQGRNSLLTIFRVNLPMLDKRTNE